ncbi:unnamed protein product [Clonostachys rosea]|uniref:CHAT domain-containing protein n=1 Tax=Bionectria ochroleuca TaxID=29856 RepID=A0ABY6U2L0_BIOOC|nr:unnamed protein product [Clonostachys rosea]
MPDLDAAIQQFELAVALETDDIDGGAQRSFDAGMRHLIDYQQSGAMKSSSIASHNLEGVIELAAADHRDQDERHYKLGVSYLIRYCEREVTADLGAAIQQLREAVDLTSQDDFHLPQRLYTLGIGYLENYRRSGATNDLDNAARSFERAVLSTPHDCQKRAQRVHTLSLTHSANCSDSTNLTDLSTAIRTLQEKVEAAPRNDSAMAENLYCLGELHYAKYAHTEEIADVDMAIELLEEAIDLTSDNHADLCDRYEKLAWAYSAKYRKTRIIEDLKAADRQFKKAHDYSSGISVRNLLRLVEPNYETQTTLAPVVTDSGKEPRKLPKSLELISTQQPDQVEELYLLGIDHLERYEATQSVEDLETGTAYLQSAIDRTPEGDPSRGERLYQLGEGLHAKYVITQDMEDLETAIQMFKNSLDLALPDDTSLSDRHDSLGTAFYHRYQALESEPDLGFAIQQFEKALDLTPKNHADQGNRLIALGTVYYARFSNTEDVADLDLSIDSFQKATDCALEDEKKQAELASNFGFAHFAKFTLTKSNAHLERVIQLFEEALDLEFDFDIVFNLGSAYREKYMRTGDKNHLDSAIEFYEEAIESMPEDHPDQAERLGNLGYGYLYRYYITGAIEDFEACFKKYQEALSAAPEEKSAQATVFYQLGFAYSAKFGRLGDNADLELAIDYCQKSVGLTPYDHPEMPSRLDVLGFNLLLKYKSTQCMNDLDSAVTQIQKAIDLVIDDTYDPGEPFQTLGLAYEYRYLKSTDMAHLESSIQYHEEAVNRTPETHPSRGQRLCMLGRQHLHKYSDTESEESLNASMDILEDILRQDQSTPEDRAFAGQHIYPLYACDEDWPAAYKAVSAVVSAIPLLSPHSLQNIDRQDVSSGFVGLASDAASICLRAGQSPYDAIRLLELGRGVIPGSSNELRADISNLQQKHPVLAEEYLQLRQQLDTPKGFRQPNHRHKIAELLQDFTETIREMPGFNRFLLEPTEDELKSAAARGPIIIVNVSQYGCDALIIECAKIRALRLPLLTIEEVRNREATIASRGSVNSELLEWLWEAVAGPVFNTIGLTEARSADWPHVYWIPTGPLTKFPIHAAGIYYDDSQDTVLDRVISSYNFSVKMLLFNRQHFAEHQPSLTSGEILLVGMDKTPGHSNLLFASQEIRELSQLCDSSNLQVCKPKRCREDVLSSLATCKIFHFAGHGQSDSKDPWNSSLLLDDGPITVANLAEMNLHKNNPFLAYLSACGTGQVKHGELIDEGLHLINACQLAGFRHVIGTLWEVNDESCVDAAIFVYEWMLARGVSDESVSEGLHNSSRKLRSKWVSDNSMRSAKRRKRLSVGETAIEQQPGQSDFMRAPRDAEGCDEKPLYWVPYVHFGI